MLICLSCRSEAPDAARFCGKCGQPFKEEGTMNGARAHGSSSTGIAVSAVLPRPEIDERELTLLRQVSAGECQCQLENKRAELAEQRVAMVEYLQALLPCAAEEHRERNRTAFEKALVEMPPLADPFWWSLIPVVGAYALRMTQQPDSATRKYSMWRAFVWALWYERCFRPKRFKNCFKGCLRFFKECIEDADVLAEALRDLEALSQVLAAERCVDDLRRLQDALAEVPSSPAVIYLHQKIARQIATAATTSTTTLTPVTPAAIDAQEHPPLPEGQRILAAIEGLWGFLDKKYAQQNRETFEQARREPETPQAMQQMARLAGTISRNVVYRYTHGESIADEQVESAIALAGFSVRHSTDIYRKISQRHLFLLEGLQHMRGGSAREPADFTNQFKQKFCAREEDASAAWAEFVLLVTSYLAERRTLNTADVTEVKIWARVFERVAELGQGERGLFMAEARRHALPERVQARQGQTKATPGTPTHGSLARNHLNGLSKDAPPADRAGSRRVGVFIDVENTWFVVPRAMTPVVLGMALTEYASAFGTVVSRWACADERSFPNGKSILRELGKAGFDLHKPQGEPVRGQSRKNAADFALIERITLETYQNRLDVCVLVSGDSDYLEKVMSLLDSDHTVRIVASKSRQQLSCAYNELQRRREKLRLSQGHAEADFFIDDLDEILQARGAIR
ncbi:MAG: NYN domain-containing protein [Chloroflexota bacterium]|nr:NYN domain-containing protein [Chloroflexota bacterium]